MFIRGMVIPLISERLNNFTNTIKELFIILTLILTFKPGPHYDISINISISITGLCRNEDSRDIIITF